MAKYTIKDFRKQFPNDAVCLDRIFQLRYGKLTHCPECGCETTFRRITTRRSYQCKHCYAQFYPTAGTVFEKTTTPLSDWFFVMYLFTTTRNGVSAKEIERALGVTYKTAWRMGHKIRQLIGKADPSKLSGIVEMDESYMLGTTANKHKDIRAEIAVEGNRNDYKTTVVGMVQRGGEVRVYKVDFLTITKIREMIRQNIDKDAVISTDESRFYTSLTRDMNRDHITVNHAAQQYRNGKASTNTIEGFWGHLKKALKSTHVHVSSEYMQRYLDEFAFRYNYRHNSSLMLHHMLSHIPHVDEFGNG